MTYSLKQKLSAVALIITLEMSYRDAARTMGIPPCVVYYFIYEELKAVNPAMYRKVRRQLVKNAERWKGEQAYDLRPLD
jgi:hypothetical protein